MTTTMEDDAHLLTGWHVRRDAEAFRSLCVRHTGLVESACRRQGSPDVAEAVQAVFLVLARRAGAVSGAKLGGWLTTTAQRVVRDQHRAASRRRRHEQEAAVEQARQRASDASEPTWADARQHLDTALASLSVSRREAVLRFYLEGKPQAQVAAELGCSTDAVKTRVYQGLEHLRAFFARRGVTMSSAVLASSLANEATASEAPLVASCMHTVVTPATAPGAAALAQGVITAMIVKTTSLVAAGFLLVSSCLTAALIAGAETTPSAVNEASPLALDVRSALLGVTSEPLKDDPAQIHAVGHFLILRLFQQGTEQRWMEEPAELKYGVGDRLGVCDPLLTVPNPFTKKPISTDLATPFVIQALIKDQKRVLHWIIKPTARRGGGKDCDLAVEKKEVPTDIVVLKDLKTGSQQYLTNLIAVTPPTTSGIIVYPYRAAAQNERDDFVKAPSEFKQWGLVPEEPKAYQPGTGPLDELHKAKMKDGALDAGRYVTDTTYYELADRRLVWWDIVTKTMMRDDPNGIERPVGAAPTP